MYRCKIKSLQTVIKKHISHLSSIVVTVKGGSHVLSMLPPFLLDGVIERKLLYPCTNTLTSIQ